MNPSRLLSLALLCCLTGLLYPAASPASDWFAFRPDPPAPDSAIDLRWLNEPEAGAHGRIVVRDGQFVHAGNGKPVRFWAVNGPSDAATTRADLRREARLLARYGVNMVRIHGRVFDKDGDPDMDRIRRVIDIVETMKTEGIYTHLSIYFPLWFTPRPDHPWLEGYNGSQHPFAALFFHSRFQEKYRSWWRALLLTPSHETGRSLVEEPALFGAEIQNEDSLFFWTFKEENIPEPQLSRLEEQFADWLVQRHGSLAKAFQSWNGLRLERDDPEAGRVAMRPLWNMVHEKTARDRETAAFLLDLQTTFYREMRAFLESLGFRGLVVASNWHTASPEVLGPLEKYSYTTCDFIDRHGYFGCFHKGDNAAWSVRPGHTYIDRSALRFDPPRPRQPRSFVHPVMDIRYDNLPSMISETTWNRPNRHRGEAPLYLACYGALQGSSAIVHFAFDGSEWKVKPRYWMQPWTLMSPAMMGQFPAAALIFRQRLVEPGALLADIRLNLDDLRQLQGTPLPQGAAFDELRLKDVPQGRELQPGQVIDPLIHYAGQTRVRFTGQAGSAKLENLDRFIRRDQKRVVASHGQLELDYDQGVLQIRAPAAQGLSGNLADAGAVSLGALTVRSSMNPGHIVMVALDQQPLERSQRMLLQVMSEEKPTGFRTEPIGEGVHRILDIGQDPWRVKALEGSVSFARPLSIQPLDAAGRPEGSARVASSLTLAPRTVYYLLTPAG